MIIRRDFLRSMAFAALATVLPDIPLPTKPDKFLTDPDAWYLLSPSVETATEALAALQHTHFELGFQVSRELVEDHMYEMEKELIMRFGAHP